MFESFVSAQAQALSRPQQPLQRVSASQALESAASLYLNPAKSFQTLEGFGAAFTEAAAVTWRSLSLERQTELLRAYFDPNPANGHGYTLCRVHMNSCDFALGNYAHADVAQDVDLHSFSIDRDRQALLPMIQAAQVVAGRSLQLLASPWSPPAWMKSNGQMVRVHITHARRTRARANDARARALATRPYPQTAPFVRASPTASRQSCFPLGPLDCALLEWAMPAYALYLSKYLSAYAAAGVTGCPWCRRPVEAARAACAAQSSAERRDT